MTAYRIYHVETGGRLRLGETLRAGSDDEAVVAARALLAPGEPGELWQGGRLVGQFTADHAFRPGAG